jgi:outer membrane protein assembly factor BamB
MNKVRRYLLFFILIAISSLLTACGGRIYIPSGWTGISVDGDTIYLAYSQFVYAIDAKNGQQIWRYPEKGSNNVTFYAAPVLTDDGQLLVGSFDHKLYSLNPTTGAQNWSYSTGSRIIGSPLATDDGIYVPSSDNKLYSLDLNGNFKWAFVARGSLWTQPIAGLDCDCIYVASTDRYIYSISTRDGSLIWEVNLNTSIQGTPALSEDKTLYAGTLGGDVVAVNASDGTVTWRKKLGGEIWSSPVLEGDRLYLGDLAGNFYALNKSAGDIDWQVKAEGRIIGTPLVTPSGVYFTSDDGYLHGVDRNGNIILTKDLEVTIYASPAMVSQGPEVVSLILVGPDAVDTLLIALDSSGTQKWVFVPPK